MRLLERLAAVCRTMNCVGPNVRIVFSWLPAIWFDVMSNDTVELTTIWRYRMS